MTREKKVISFTVEEKELATLQASLKLWKSLEGNHADGMRQEITAPYRQFFDNHDPLTAREIDGLAGRLRSGGVVDAFLGDRGALGEPQRDRRARA